MTETSDNTTDNGSQSSERAFLHALSTPLSTLGLMIESLIESAGPLPQEQLEALRKYVCISGRIHGMIRERRAQLKD